MTLSLKNKKREEGQREDVEIEHQCLIHAFHFQFFFLTWMIPVWLGGIWMLWGTFLISGLEALPYIMHQARARVGNTCAMGMHVPHVEKLSYPNASGTLAVKHDFP